MRGFIRILLLLMLIVAVSCRDRSSALPLSDYVTAVLNDTSYAEYHVIREFTPDILGSVAVVGDAQDVLPIVEKLITGDHFDNIDGRAVPDGLADFAGEHVAAYLYESSPSFYESRSGREQDELRTLSVKEFIAALDSSCLYSPYDSNVTEHKSRAKVVVLATSFTSAYGYKDIDTLCQLAGLRVPVLSAADEMLAYAIAKSPQPAKLCLWTTPDRAEAGLYNDIYRRSGGRPGDLRVITPSGEAGSWASLISFLDKYMEDGSLRQISAIAVDDPSVNPEVLKGCCDSLRRSTDETLIQYRNLFSNDFELVFAPEVVARSCYGLLREDNGFTHRVAAPEVTAYALNDSSVVKLRDTSSLSDNLRSLMEQKAPKTLSRYVRP